MEAELAALAVSGATTLVGLMASDAWAATKASFVALFRRGSADPDSVDADLETTRAQLVAARAGGDGAAAAGIEALWRMRFHQLLLQDPAMEQSLRDVLAEVTSTTPPHAVRNVISGGDIHGPVIQTGTINGDLHFG